MKANPAPDARSAPPQGSLFWRPELDTYKQLLQPNRHAGSSLFYGFPNTLKPRGIYDQKSGHFYRSD
jgi:hypothetical protein